MVLGDEHSRASAEFTLTPAHASIRFRHALTNIPLVAETAAAGHLAFGTIDTWLVYRVSLGCTLCRFTVAFIMYVSCQLTNGVSHVTDVSCASGE